MRELKISDTHVIQGLDKSEFDEMYAMLVNNDPIAFKEKYGKHRIDLILFGDAADVNDDQTKKLLKPILHIGVRQEGKVQIDNFRCHCDLSTDDSVIHKSIKDSWECLLLRLEEPLYAAIFKI